MFVNYYKIEGFGYRLDKVMDEMVKITFRPIQGVSFTIYKKPSEKGILIDMWVNVTETHAICNSMRTVGMNIYPMDRDVSALDSIISSGINSVTMKYESLFGTNKDTRVVLNNTIEFLTLMITYLDRTFRNTNGILKVLTDKSTLLDVVIESKEMGTMRHKETVKKLTEALGRNLKNVTKANADEWIQHTNILLTITKNKMFLRRVGNIRRNIILHKNKLEGMGK